MINAELLNEIDDEFERTIKSNKRIRSLYKKIRDGTTDTRTAQQFAIEIGKDLSKTFGTKITVAELPNGKMTFEIANEVIRPEIVKGYNYTASYFNEVQQNLYKSKSLNIKGAKPDLMESRIDGFVEKLTSDEYETVKWILEDPAYIVNYLEAVVDTGIKNNTGMLGQAGIRSKIIREVDSGACPWCMNLAGEYEYGEEPDDVYRRHRDCHCTVTFDFKDGFRQDSWSKNWFTDNPDWQLEKKKRIEWSDISNAYEKRDITNKRYVAKGKLTQAEAKRLEQLLTN